MKFENVIREAFSRLEFEPRPGQIEAVNSILDAFITQNKENVILNGSTGAGKSILGIVTAECISTLVGKAGKDKACSSIILSHTNVLNKQYYNSFKNLGEREFVMIKGAGNYSCSALSQGGLKETADACAFSVISQNSQFGAMGADHCGSCDYNKMKSLRRYARHLSTNYSYYFVDRMYTNTPLEERDIVIWDEAHLVNDLFSDHNAIFFSVKRIQTYIEEINRNLNIPNQLTIIKTLNLISQAIVSGSITEKNFQIILKKLTECYTTINLAANSAAESAFSERRTGEYLKMKRLSKKYEGLACKIGDFFNYKYEHIFEHNPTEESISVKPIFVGKMFSVLKNAQRNLFMSATISDKLMYETLGLTSQNTAFIKLDPTFEPENKRIVFFNPMSLNYNSLKNRDTIDDLVSSVSKIVKHHTKKGDRGIILTPSFKLQDEITRVIRSSSFTLYEQKKGDTLESTVAKFKAHKGKDPAILVSPSMFEGVDLPGELSRYQILVKAPYPSLGDKRMKYIMENHKTIYELGTLMKIVQGAGRSIRSPEDYATTYILDRNAQRLFYSNLNVWKDEFSIKET